MGVSNGIISAPVNLREPYICMGVGKYEGWYHLGYICSNAHGKINMWSKHKPVEVNSPKEVSEATLKQLNYGLVPGVKKSTGAVGNLTKIDDVKDAGWFYEPPYTFARLTDFIGYYHYAEPFIATRLGSSIEINQFNGGTFTFSPDIILEDTENRTISLADLGDMLDGYYYAVALKGPGTNNVWREYKGSNIKTDPNGGVTINSAGLTKGTYQVALYLSSSASENAGDMMPLPKDVNNQTWLTANIVFKAPFEIELEWVSKTLNGTYTYINDLTEYFPMPGSGTLYFKGVLRCLEPASRFIQDTALNGRSDMFGGGTNTKALHNCIFNENKAIINSLDLYDMQAGDEKVIYIKWDGYTGGSEPDNDEVIDGALEILYNYGSTSQTVAYVGGSPGFEVIS